MYFSIVSDKAIARKRIIFLFSPALFVSCCLSSIAFLRTMDFSDVYMQKDCNGDRGFSNVRSLARLVTARPDHFREVGEAKTILRLCIPSFTRWLMTAFEILIIRFL